MTALTIDQINPWPPENPTPEQLAMMADWELRKVGSAEALAVLTSRYTFRQHMPGTDVEQ